MEDEWKAGKKTLQVAILQRMISIKKRKGSGRNMCQLKTANSLTDNK